MHDINNLKVAFGNQNAGVFQEEVWTHALQYVTTIMYGFMLAMNTLCIL